MASLAEIRAKLNAQENRNQDRTANTENVIYPHWNMEEGTTATFRFLPDQDPNNPFFWKERLIIKLPFNGIKGQTDNHAIVQVPCMETWGETCPVLSEVRPWYKDDSLKETANKYWKKRSYLYQGFVRANPIGNDISPANPIRRFIISPSIQGIIKASLMDPELEELPTDYVRGLDFNVKKANKGGYADYSTSNWARKETPLTQAELDAIQDHGLFNLSDFLPKKPNEAELRIIHEMFEASVDGEAYDPSRWANYYKPHGFDNNSEQKVNETPNHREVQTLRNETKEPKKDSYEEAVSNFEETITKSKESAGSSNSAKAADILELIRARQSK